MSRALWISASGMAAQQLRTENIANNMANVNTTSYKKGVVRFQDMLYQKQSAPGSASATGSNGPGIQMGTGVRVATASKLFTQGVLEKSSADLDMAIEGQGFFQVELPSGETGYTRAGNFHKDANGTVVTGEGYPVVGFPTLDPNAASITIHADGTVSTFTGGVTTNAGQIQLARIPNAEAMEYIGRNMYKTNDLSGTATLGTPGGDFGNIAQHALEGSNVDIVKEMVDMISSQRAYELNSKSIKNADEMMAMVARLK